jgi:putative PIN family toxin of toxin-antitoxin system
MHGGSVPQWPGLAAFLWSRLFDFGCIFDTIFRMKAVIDTNVFLGACLGTGAANRTIAACLRGEVTPLMGAALLAEYEDVLGRDALLKKSRLNEEEEQTLLDIFLSKSEWVRVYFAWRPNLPDEADNHLVELAVAGGADFIVTLNLRDLQRMELRFPQFKVVTPEAFLKELAS